MRTLLIALFIFTLVPSFAQANGNGNGGGTKPTAAIKVRNNGSQMLAVIVDPSDDILDDLDARRLTTTDFILAGGRFVPRNGSTTFGGLQSGPHTVVAAFVSNVSNNATVSTAGSAEVTLNNGQTQTVTFTGSVNGGAIGSGGTNGNGTITTTVKVR
jgi:hypothetical protein